MTAFHGERVTSIGEDPASRLIAQVNAWLAAGCSVDVRQEAAGNASENFFDLESALQSSSWLGLGPAVGASLDRLRKKVEVARKLYRFYVPDLSRPADSALLSPAGVTRLCGLLLKAALVWRDARYLNSALKLLDGVLGRDDCVFPDELRALAAEALEYLVPMALRIS